MMRPHSGFENFVPKGLLGGGKTPRPAKRAAEQPPGGGSGGGNKGRKFSARIVSKTIASRQHDAISCLNSPSHEFVFVAKKALYAEKQYRTSQSLPLFSDDGNENKFEITLPIQYLGVGLLALYLYWNMGEGGNTARVHEISFQEFKTKLLGQV